MEWLGEYTGHAAGVATALLWTGTSVCFTAASRRLGPTAVNTLRIVVAVALLGVTHRLLAGAWAPEARPAQVAFLAASGFVGLSVGDQALFMAFIAIGPRLATLIMTTSPIFAAVFGYLALSERLSPLSLAGMATTIAGIVWVVRERPAIAQPGSSAPRTRGVLLALVAAACQGGGLLLSKKGMGHGWLAPDERMTPQAATLVRMCFAALGMIPILLLHARRRAARRRALAAPSGDTHTPASGFSTGVLLTLAGAVCGPFLGVWMSLVASDRASVGVAQTLCSLTPIFILPVAAWLYRERLTLRAALGAVVAVAGAALLFVDVG